MHGHTHMRIHKHMQVTCNPASQRETTSHLGCALAASTFCWSSSRLPSIDNECCVRKAHIPTCPVKYAFSVISTILVIKERHRNIKWLSQKGHILSGKCQTRRQTDVAIPIQDAQVVQKRGARQTSVSYDLKPRSALTVYVPQSSLQNWTRQCSFVTLSVFTIVDWESQRKTQFCVSPQWATLR